MTPLSVDLSYHKDRLSKGVQQWLLSISSSCATDNAHVALHASLLYGTYKRASYAVFHDQLPFENALLQSISTTISFSIDASNSFRTPNTVRYFKLV